jgi:hypothetical protein
MYSAASPCAKVRHSRPALTTKHMRIQSYQNVQFFAENRQIQGEPVVCRLSLDASCLLKELCISIAIWETDVFTWGRRTVTDGNI